MQFSPGNKSKSARMIHYHAIKNANATNDAVNLQCRCIQNQYTKMDVDSSLVNSKLIYKHYIAHLCRHSVGGSTYFGNFYLGQPLSLNYLGRMEGMAGGSGSPPVNRF